MTGEKTNDEWDEYDGATREEINIPQEKVTTKEVIKEVPIEKEVVIEKPVYVEKIIEKPVIKEKIIEKPVIKEKIVYKKNYVLKDFDLGKILTWLGLGIIGLSFIAGFFWIKNQEWQNTINKPKEKIVYKATKPKIIYKEKIKWKTKTVSINKDNKILKENLATAYARIDYLTKQVGSQRPVQCKFKHRLRIIDRRR